MRIILIQSQHCYICTSVYVHYSHMCMILETENFGGISHFSNKSWRHTNCVKEQTHGTARPTYLFIPALLDHCRSHRSSMMFGIPSNNNRKLDIVGGKQPSLTTISPCQHWQWHCCNKWYWCWDTHHRPTWQQCGRCIGWGFCVCPESWLHTNRWQ